MTLTKIYCMTHPYQTLVREITTPTLPAFITSCLNLVSSKSSKAQDGCGSTAEVVFRSFATLLPRHTTIYRPFVSQLRAVAKPFVAPTLSDGIFVPSSLSQCARHVTVLSHMTVAKNAGGEEWGKAVRDLLKVIHVTADSVFRAVVEDWESTAGYVAEHIDINVELSGGLKSAEDFPRWNGIDAGVERMVGLLELLIEYFKTETSLPVSIPLGAVADMLMRMLSIAISSPSQTGGQGHARLHPAIDRDEKDGLCSGIPHIYVAALQVIITMSERLQEGFVPLAQGFLDQLAWLFQYGKHDRDFRLHAYRLTAQILLQTGQALGKSTSSKCSGIIKSCCNDLIPVAPKSLNSGSDVDAAKKPSGSSSNTNQNADSFLQDNTGIPQEMSISDTDITIAAKELLPMFSSHFPQQNLDISLRSLLERTAILNDNKDAMLAAILNPYVAKNGKSMASILPHLTRSFPNDEIVEILLRPRMPLVPSLGVGLLGEEGAAHESEDEDEYKEEDTDMDLDGHNSGGTNDDVVSGGSIHLTGVSSTTQDTSMNHPGLSISTPSLSVASDTQHGFAAASSSFNESMNNQVLLPQPHAPLNPSQAATAGTLVETKMTENDSDSDDESVHLTMQLDTDSESEG